MLLASLTFHAGLAATVAFSVRPGASNPKEEAITPLADAPSILLLRTKAASLSTPPVAAKPPVVVAIAKPSAAFRSPPLIPIEKTTPAVTEPTALALEANPNAHVRAIAPESILSPNPAPRLNNAGGIVFILDISGSMYEPCAGSTRIALARQCLARQIIALKNGTPFAITLYALRAYNSGPLVAANDATRGAAIRFIMREVDCGGGTNLPAGFASAQRLHPGALVLVTDGDLNSTAFSLAAKTRELLGPYGECPNLTIVGISPRASEQAEPLLQSLADQEGGTYRTQPSEAGAELITSASSALKPSP
jgi:Mg-chelatase subunit ChlD